MPMNTHSYRIMTHIYVELVVIIIDSWWKYEAMDVG